MKKLAVIASLVLALASVAPVAAWNPGDDICPNLDGIQTKELGWFKVQIDTHTGELYCIVLHGSH